MHKNWLITLIIFIAFDLGAFAQEPEYMKPGFANSNKTSAQYLVNAGLSYNKLNIDSPEITAMGTPYLGMSIRHDMASLFVLELAGQWTRRGADVGYLEYEYRNDYFDFQGIANLQLGEGFFLNIGFQHSLLLNSFMRKYTDVSQLEYVKSQTNSFNHQNMVLMGAGFRLTKSVEFGLLYTYPFENNQFSNIQFGVKINLSKLKRKEYGKKYYDLNEALKDPLSVRSFVLHRKELSNFPMDILQFTNLEKLVLDGNQLKTLPPEIAQLRQLKFLSVQYNDISSLPDEICLLSNLEELALGNNQLKQLPNEIGKLTALRFFYLGKNNLTHLPASIGNLTNLVELDVAKSGVMLDIPASVFNLRRLERLYIDRTTVLPMNFFSGTRLQILFK